MDASRLTASRFRGDAELFESLRANPRVGPRLAEAKPTLLRNSIRMQLLQTAVRVDARLLPQIAGSLKRLHDSAGLNDPVETYVFESSAINAFVTRGRSHLFVALSSGAINTLSPEELEFVIGHELGHALFEHVDFGVGHLLEAGGVEPRDRMQMFAWKRAAEISADRVGLICCGSAETAGTAMFKTISGLNLPNLKIDIAAFAEQWDHLLTEVVESGDNDGHWQITHPFPPLRMKALHLFSQSDFYAGSGDKTGSNGKAGEKSARPTLASVDAETSKLLALMDPLARDDRTRGDPMLADYFLWGGLHIALANGELNAHEKSRMNGVVSPATLDAALSKGATFDGSLNQFDDLLKRRQLKLKSLEIFRILEGLLQIAHADGEMDARERKALEDLAGKLGISPPGVEMVIAKFHSER